MRLGSRKSAAPRGNAVVVAASRHRGEVVIRFCTDIDIMVQIPRLVVVLQGVPASLGTFTESTRAKRAILSNVSSKQSEF